MRIAAGADEDLGDNIFSSIREISAKITNKIFNEDH